MGNTNIHVDYNAEEIDIILNVQLVTGCLSLFGCSIVLLSFYLFPQLRNLSFALILNMNVAEVSINDLLYKSVLK